MPWRGAERKRQGGTRVFGTRVFDGRYFLLAERGPKAAMERLAADYRARGYYARVVAWNPFERASLRMLLDDYAVFTFPRETA